MKVFVTGASGFIGRATCKELLARGHKVYGLARSDKSIELLKKLGVEPVSGDLDDIETLKKNAIESDGVIHVAYKHDFLVVKDPAESQKLLQDAVDSDIKVIQSICEALEGSNKPFVGVSGFGYLHGVENDEFSEPQRGSGPFARQAGIDVLLSYADKGVRSSVVRIPPITHGEEDMGFFPMIGKAAQGKGAVMKLSDGKNHWITVEKNDLAQLICLSLEKGKPGATYHAFQETLTTNEIYQYLSELLNLPIEETPVDEGMKYLGFIAPFLTMDLLASCEFTKKELGWKPTGPSLAEDARAYYFK
ncbi:uncharacterized protein CLIB1444_19S00210 [[Candida] jaroonii]|uniref:Uncharacterized protein n=1 Tax=[Candida] jaroonii TaxID=467808 RepID=A0ACA9YGC0_9ASCO|nr:uncharacterized protein CLIB1444_19S00210 [[Candida] jaroonii]